MTRGESHLAKGQLPTPVRGRLVSNTKARKLIVTMCLAAAACQTGEAVSPVSEGIGRICTYPDQRGGNRTRTLSVAATEPCPKDRVSNSGFPAPPTARLEDSLVTQDSRQCIYVQGQRRWTFRVMLTQVCPLNAGLAQQVALDDNSP